MLCMIHHGLARRASDLLGLSCSISDAMACSPRQSNVSLKRFLPSNSPVKCAVCTVLVACLFAQLHQPHLLCNVRWPVCVPVPGVTGQLHICGERKVQPNCRAARAVESLGLLSSALSQRLANTSFPPPHWAGVNGA